MAREEWRNDDKRGYGHGNFQRVDLEQTKTPPVIGRRDCQIVYLNLLPIKKGQLGRQGAYRSATAKIANKLADFGL